MGTHPLLALWAGEG